ncbi:MAG: helix-turn-helix transcriptional regulator [Rhodospirillales bacterium]|nr:helix-turn-helix transcriptional regulator [Rhodospirillales bacterium]
MAQPNIDAGGAVGRGGPVVRVIAKGPDWAIYDYTCNAGPRDRPFEEMHDGATIAAVVAGSFTYRSGSGRALLYPGAFLLGNAGKCFECGHDHSTGDRCIAFNFAPALFAEISATAAGTSGYAFPAATLPISKGLTAIVARTERVDSTVPPDAAGEVAAHVAETVIAAMSGHVARPVRFSSRDEQRITDALNHIEAHASGPLELDVLANLVCMSKYHFLRVFRRVVGMTPYQYLLSVRMRRAASRLAGTAEGVASIAFDSGFGDLSTFNHRFRDLFGMTPVAYRRRGLV